MWLNDSTEGCGSLLPFKSAKYLAVIVTLTACEVDMEEREMKKKT